MPTQNRNRLLAILRQKQKEKYGDFKIPLEPSFGELSPFDKALDLLQRPGHTVTGALAAGLKGQNPFAGAWAGLSGQDRTGVGDILKEQGVAEGPGRSFAGFLGDVATDPLTYVGVGPVEKAGSLAVGGVERALTKPAMEALEAARGLKTAQAARILTKGAELKPTAILGGMPEGVRLATGGTEMAGGGARVIPKMATEAGRHSLVGGMAPRLSQESLDKLLVSAGRAAPEVKTLARDLSTAALKGPKGEELLGRGFAAKQAAQVLEGGKSTVPALQKLAAPVKGAASLMEAPNAIKFAGIPLVKTATLKAPIKAAWEGAKKLPVVGAAVRAIGKAGQATGEFAGKIFSSKAGLHPEEAAIQESARDLMHLRMRREVEFAEGVIGDLKKAGFTDEGKLAKAHEEIDKTMEGVLTKTKEMAEPEAKAHIQNEIGRLSGSLNKILGEKKPLDKVLSKIEAGIERVRAVKESPATDPAILKSLKRQEGKISVQAGRDALKEARLGAQMTGEPIPKVAPTGLFAEAQKAAREKAFGKVAGERATQLDKEVVRLSAQLSKAKTAPERLAVEAALQSKRDALEIAKEKLGKLKPIEVLTEKRVPYGEAPEPLKSIASKISEHLQKNVEQEQKLLTLPPETREFYLPHYLKPEMEQALRSTVYGANPERIMRSGVSGASVKAALRRTNKKGVLELTLSDMIHGNMIDPDKLEKVLAEKGVPFSAADRLVFETDPVKAALRRGLSTARAVSAAEMRDELMNSPTFLKSKVNLLDEAGVKKAEDILATHSDHDVYVTTRDYIQHFMSDNEREALRTGSRPDLVRALAVKVSADDLEKLAKRVGPGVSKVEGFVLPREVVDHLNKAHEFQFMPEAVGNFLKFYDSVQHLFTTSATVVRPGFHIRNAIGNFWNMMLAGVRDPGSLFVASAMQRGKFAGLKPIGGLQPEEIWKLFQELGGQRSGWAGSAEDIVKRATSPSKNIFSPQGPVARVGSKVGGAIEDNAKLALFIDGLQKGMDPRSAMWRSKKFLFDYSDLSWTEKNVFKRFAPFFAWTRKNVPLQLEQLITNPGKVGMIGHAREAADKDFEELDRPAVADWMQKSLGIPFKKNEDGSISYALLGGLIPTGDLARMDSKQLISMLSPLVKVPLEQMFNEDWFRGRPISRFPGPIPGAGEMVEFMGIPMPARLAHIARNAIVLAQVDRALFSEDAGLGGWTNVVLGVKPYKQFPEKQLKTYFYQREHERHGLEQEAEKQKGLGNEFIANQLASRAETLQGRAMTAKAKTLGMNPLAFTPKPSTRPQLAPTTAQQFKARVKGQLAKMYGRKVAMR